MYIFLFNSKVHYSAGDKNLRSEASQGHHKALSHILHSRKKGRKLQAKLEREAQRKGEEVIEELIKWWVILDKYRSLLAI